MEEFYTKEFTCGNTSIARGDWEDAPDPICMSDVDDETMEYIARALEEETKENRENMSEDKADEIWWSEYERLVLANGAYYYSEEV